MTDILFKRKFMNPELRARAIETLGQLKIAKKGATELVDAVGGTTEAELVRNALRRGQAGQAGLRFVC
jgi:hypothetical protein